MLYSQFKIPNRLSHVVAEVIVHWLKFSLCYCEKVAKGSTSGSLLDTSEQAKRIAVEIFSKSDNSKQNESKSVARNEIDCLQLPVGSYERLSETSSLGRHHTIERALHGCFSSVFGAKRARIRSRTLVHRPNWILSLPRAAYLLFWSL